jgi:hypothetical protein
MCYQVYVSGNPNFKVKYVVSNAELPPNGGLDLHHFCEESAKDL